MSKHETCPECGCFLTDPAEHSDKARARFFAIMEDCYQNLPDHWRPLIASKEHLRKYVLCQVGHCDTVATDCGSEAAAERVAALAKNIDTFVVTKINGQILLTMTARSLRKRVCPKALFMPISQASYDYLRLTFGYDADQSEFRAAA
jgi:hypothetical protein